MRRVHDRNGSTLVMAILVAVIFAVAAYAVLYMSLGMRQRADFSERNLRARYAAESGYIIAMQRRWTNPNDCPPSTPFDDDDNPATPDVTLNFTCNGSQIDVQVNY